MMQRLRHLAVHLALAAMMLRGLMPVGWMPNPDAASQSFLTICTMYGPIHHVDQHGPRKSDDGQHSHEECPFAAAPHVASSATVAQIAPPSYSGQFFNPPAAHAASVRLAVYQPQSPRAPPLAA